MRVILIILFMNAVSSLKILGIFPYSGKSHFNAYEPILQEIARRGHEIHVLSEFPQKTPIDGYKDLILKTDGRSTKEVIDLTHAPPKWLIRYGVLGILKGFAEHTCSKLNQKVVKDLLSAKENYDLILIEHFITDCFLGFAHRMKIPHIAMSSFYIMPWHYDRFGYIGNPAIIPNHFGNFATRMSFFERLENSFMYLYTIIYYKWFMDIPGNKIAKELFGNDLPPLEKIAENASLYMISNFFALNEPKPLPPGVIEVGGILSETSGNKIPLDIEKWINESKDGVVYLSMGSMIIGKSFPEGKRQIIQNAFSKLKQRVLWKWENDTMPGKPHNVMIQKWLPQADILCYIHFSQQKQPREVV